MADVSGVREDHAGADPTAPDGVGNRADGVSRRRFIGFLIAGPTLIAAVPQFVAPDGALAAVPTAQLVDSYDLSDLLNDAAAPTSSLISVTINTDGTASFAMPRAEVGQGITTACAMVIADELSLSVDQVSVTLADAMPELVWNQFTGGSNTMHSIYLPLRAAAAIAKGALLDAASAYLDEPVDDLSVLDGVVGSPSGASVTYGQLAGQAAVTANTPVVTTLQPSSTGTIVGTPTPRVDARDIVTGRKQFAMDLAVADALPTMVCRPPTINGSVVSVNNLAAVQSMPGVTDVVAVPHTAFVPGGVAVRAQTFGQCIDAIRALDVSWRTGDAGTMSESDVAAELAASAVPLTPALPLVRTLDRTFTFNFRPGDPLEPNCAVADVTSTSAEVWASLKSPIWAKEQLVTILGLPLTSITVHVAQGGGSFGRHLFSDSTFEAAVISQKLGKPVKLMWARTDSFRQGRCHPMATSQIRVTYAGRNVLALDQRHTSVATDFSMGFGELLSATAATVPEGNLAFAQTVFDLTANCPYNFGPVTQVINEAYQYNTFNTGSVRNIYSPDVCTALELMVDQTAAAMGQDPYAFRQGFVRDPRLLAVLNSVATAGSWGRAMPAGTAQGMRCTASTRLPSRAWSRSTARPRPSAGWSQTGSPGPA